LRLVDLWALCANVEQSRLSSSEGQTMFAFALGLLFNVPHHQPLFSGKWCGCAYLASCTLAPKEGRSRRGNNSSQLTRLASCRGTRHQRPNRAQQAKGLGGRCDERPWHTTTGFLDEARVYLAAVILVSKSRGRATSNLTRLG
jgi:hypothetical protein